MTEVIAFIDGFNLYHAIVDKDSRSPHTYYQFKWLNYKELVNCFLETGDNLKDIKLFTAYFQHNPRKKSRHKKLNMVQKDLGVDIIFGRFRDVEKKCRLCHRKYWIPEEKRTDVNIAS